MNVLLVDTAFAAVPVYDYLIQAGHNVWVIGNRENDILARRAASRWIKLDYSDFHKVENYVRDLAIESIVPGCTDVSMDTCLRLKINSLLVDTPETNYSLNNKIAFRHICEKLNLPSPQAVSKDGFPATGRFICKPADAFSGRGVTVFDGRNRAALIAAYEVALRASPSATAIIESFIEGQLYSCSTFIENGKPTTVFYVREGSSANLFAVDTSYVVYNLPEKYTAILEKSLEKLCLMLGLKNGLLHAQFILNEDGPWIIEVARRCPGDLYSLLIEYSTGFKYAAKYASYFIGAAFSTHTSERRYILRHTVSAVEDTIFGGIKFSIPMVTQAFFPLEVTGQKLCGHQGTRCGIVFCESPSPEHLISNYEAFLARRAYTVS